MHSASDHTARLVGDAARTSTDSLDFFDDDNDNDAADDNLDTRISTHEYSSRPRRGDGAAAAAAATRDPPSGAGTTLDGSRYDALGIDLATMSSPQDRRPALARGSKSEIPLLYKSNHDDAGGGADSYSYAADDAGNRGRGRSSFGVAPGYDEEEHPPRPLSTRPSLGPNAALSSHSYQARSRSLHSRSPSHSNVYQQHAAPAHPSGAARPTFSRRSTMRSRSPKDEAAARAARKKYTYAAFFLVLSLVSFCIQTELSAHIQHDLGWDKAYCMMYFTHGSWVVLWPLQLLVLRLQQWNVPWPVFWRKHLHMLRTTAVMVETQMLDVSRASVLHSARPVRYVVRFTALITSALTVAGLSWYIAVSLTTPSDLTAIYNCSAFFAYVFSVPLLKEPLRLDKSVAVLIAIAGVLVVAYGDTKDSGSDQGDTGAGSRFLGNLVIGVGSVLYGLYEVLYKRFACPPEGASPFRGMTFAITFGACIGAFTLTVLWLPLPLIDWLGLEKFELPDASTGWLVLAAVLANATFSGSFLVLISLTSPVLSSVAALLTIFLVALVDWFITGEPLSAAAILGGTMIILAFLGLSWSTYRELKEHAAVKVAVDFTDSDQDDDDDDDDDDGSSVHGDGRLLRND